MWEKEIILSGSKNKLVRLYTVPCVSQGGVSGTAPKQMSGVTAPRPVHTYYLNTLQGKQFISRQLPKPTPTIEQQNEMHKEPQKILKLKGQHKLYSG